MIKVFIGFDERETVAYHALCQSLMDHASEPISITPLHVGHLKGLLTRERDPLQSTDFAFSRFLTPYLSDFTGWSVFMDCDIVIEDDIAKLWRLREDRFAVQVVKHDHRPPESRKFLGQRQTCYEKKNWSSVMLFNNAKCTALTPAYVNSARGLELHQFKWLNHDALIGELPSRWNVLVGYDAPRFDAAALHFTSGGPYFSESADSREASRWFHYHKRLNAVITRDDAKQKTVSAA